MPIIFGLFPYSAMGRNREKKRNMKMEKKAVPSCAAACGNVIVNCKIVLYC